MKRKDKIKAAEKLARKIERWHKILAPEFPEIDPHDLDLIIAAKESANRSKDKATLQILNESLRVRGRMGNEKKKESQKNS